MNRRTTFLNALLIITAIAVSGCASVKKADSAKDSEVKQFVASPNKAQVYIYRNEVLGAALAMPVTVDGKLIGKTGPKSFFKLDLTEGKHTLTSQGSESTLDLNTENGKIYYVWQEVKMGVMSGGSKLQLVDAAKGQKGVKECSLIDASL